ncbi:toxin-antitoxin system HicB family antitoxin [Mycolicibacterium sp.]|uniref:type II toxin-antitoxin system HicB family antitoxin n=1 Tax=Mycolicibacterium sp. TaxID=2320850 RepID=UPI0028A8B357|nr:toxin-antitoxin system HicB family antitoxin [Mycolicibacterium sp.]
MAPNYSYRADWSPESNEYQARCLEFPGRYGRGFTAHEAVADMESIVAETLHAIVADGETPPESLTDRRYSGNILVRASPSLHGRLVVEAFEQGVSLNRWVLQKLAERPVTLNDLFG